MFRAMKLFFVFAFVCGISSNHTSPEDLPILGVIGGGRSVLGQFPYQVMLKQRNHICGGALIAPDIVLTAAHCTRDVPVFSLSVVAGTTNRFIGGKSIRVDRIVEHPKYAPNAHDEYDLAILFLQKSFKYGPLIQRIELPQAGETIPADAIATVSGWGIESKTSDKPVHLKFAHLPIWSNSDCYGFLKVIKSPIYCGGDQDGLDNACSGDSGGPLTYNNKLFGVVSFGFPCGSLKNPTVYTDVAALRDWILGITQL